MPALRQSANCGSLYATLYVEQAAADVLVLVRSVRFSRLQRQGRDSFPQPGVSSCDMKLLTLLGMLRRGRIPEVSPER